MERNLPVIEFGLAPADQDSSARLVLRKIKRATTALLASYAYDREPVPRAGERRLVLDGRRREVAVIAYRRVAVRRYRDVDATYAAIEGEGDGSLAHWRAAHWSYLGAECARVGLALSEDVEVTLEYFDLVEPLIRLEDF